MTEPEEPRRRPVSDGLEVDLDGPYVIFDGKERAGVDGDYDCGVLPEASIRPLELAALDAALGMIAEDTGDRLIDTWVIDTDPPTRTYDVEMLEGIALHTGGQGELCALIDIELPRYIDEEFEARVPELLEPMMARLGAEAKAPFHSTGIFTDGNFIVMVEIPKMSGKRVADLLDLALDVQALLRAARKGEFDRGVARDLLRAGHVHVLVGKAENQWLEVKSQMWPLDTPAGKAEAAKDLSALANAGGGILVIPARSSSEAGQDVITEVKAIPLNLFNELQLRDTLADWTFPPLQGLEIDIVERVQGRGVIVLNVPPCRDQDWPHLVVGDDDAAFPSAAVSAYYRDGDKNRSLSAAEFHSLIREGRQAGGEPAAGA
jgi:hypothetical protein